jgi:dethiobiotin synthetase
MAIKNKRHFPKLTGPGTEVETLRDSSTTDDRFARTKNDSSARKKDVRIVKPHHPSSSRSLVPFPVILSEAKNPDRLSSPRSRIQVNIFNKAPRRLFITGTDTGVGKTVISAILMAGLNGFYWKPIQSGLEEMTDTEWVRGKTGLPETHFFQETYRLTRPLSPHASARHDGIRIELDSFNISDAPESGHLIIEGAGGIMVPLNDTDLMTDLMKRLAAPVLLVCRSSLGTINHTLLSLEQLRREELDVFGVVMNGPRNTENREAIEHYGGIRVLAEIEPMPVIDPQNLKNTFQEHFGYLMRKQ